MYFANNTAVTFEEAREKFPDSETMTALLEFKEGYVLAHTGLEKDKEICQDREVIVLKKIAGKVCIMASKEHIIGLKIKHEENLQFLIEQFEEMKRQNMIKKEKEPKSKANPKKE